MPSSARSRRVLAALAFLLLLGGEARAWGPGTHIFQGEELLRHAGLLLPAVAALLRRRPGDFLYGCLAPDFFLLKGSRRREGHIHDWRVGHRLLAWAQGDAQRSFAYGYLAHLAADVVSHNFYVPNQIYLSRLTERVGHLYWEMRADRSVRPDSWQRALEVALADFDGNDELLREVLRMKYVFYRTSRRFHARYFRILDRGRRLGRTIREWDRHSRLPLPLAYVARLQQTSLALAADLLRDPAGAVAYRYDPAGIRNIRAAKGLRRAAILNGRPRERDRVLFTLPEELLALRHRSRASLATA